MLSVYTFQEDGFTLEFFQCEDLTSEGTVDHLHFTLQYDRGVYHESMEGFIYFDPNSDNEQSIAEKVRKLYLDKTMCIAQEQIRNGAIILQ